MRKRGDVVPFSHFHMEVRTDSQPDSFGHPQIYYQAYLVGYTKEGRKVYILPFLASEEMEP